MIACSARHFSATSSFYFARFWNLGEIRTQITSFWIRVRPAGAPYRLNCAASDLGCGICATNGMYHNSEEPVKENGRPNLLGGFSSAQISGANCGNLRPCTLRVKQLCTCTCAEFFPSHHLGVDASGKGRYSCSPYCWLF